MLAFFAMFWYCFDDHLAVALGAPWVANFPLWAWAIIVIALSFSTLTVEE